MYINIMLLVLVLYSLSGIIDEIFKVYVKCVSILNDMTMHSRMHGRYTNTNMQFRYMG